MAMGSLLKRAGLAFGRWNAAHLARRPYRMRAGRPIVSFTFDDFPRSAWTAGGPILARHGARATYYTALGLAGGDGVSGPHFTPEDLRALAAAGHEVGCHTHAHCPAWETPAEKFEASVARNAEQFGSFLPGTRLRSLSYPVSPPRAATKLRMGKRFACCRGGGQTYNAGLIDLNCLRGFFLEQTRGDARPLAAAIAASAAEDGWLILVTHDISPRPSRHGVTPCFLEHALNLAQASGAVVLPVAAAWDRIAAR
jgi:peptidoglycan/xylan/chitin deacetylase (PgdA/CDA1 family)